MGYIEDQLERIVRDLDKIIKMRTQELDALPEGKIRHTRNNGKTVTYHVTKQDGKLRRTVIHDSDLILRLLRREFLDLYIENNTARLNGLTVLLEDLQKLRDDDSILHEIVEQSYPDADEELRRKIGCPVNTGADSWADAEYRQSQYKPEYKRFRTSRGLKVRSKSEVIIAEMLYSYGIPFRYEEEICIDGVTYAPDFTILCPDGRTVYWEHLGLVSSLRYYDSQLSKLRMYYSAGIVPWKNLILSYDDDSGVIDASSVRNLIETRILRAA